MNVNTEVYIALRDHLDGYTNKPHVIYPPWDDDLPADLFWIVQDARLPVQSPFIDAGSPKSYSGSFQVHIMAPKILTHVQLMYQVDLVAGHFPDDVRLETSGGLMQFTGGTGLATEPYKDGNYYRAPMVVPWRISA